MSNPKHLAKMVTLAALGLTLAGALSGCTSLSKRAQEQLAAGDYDRAAATYERILQRNPKDPEAQAGLKQARTGIIDRRLIAARQARQSGNPDQALDILLDVLAKEKQWDFTPGSKVGYTQEEEMGFAVKTASANVRALLTEDRALRAEKLLARYEPMYLGKNRALHGTLSAEITKKGKERCKGLLKADHSERPYFVDFVIRYCGHWKESAPGLAKISASKTGTLVRSLELLTEVAGAPDGAPSQFQKQLIESLKKTAWYHAQGGKSLPVRLNGSFEKDLDKVEISLVHQYSVEESYVDTQKVRKTRQVPYTASRKVLDSATGKYRDESYTAYREESYYVDEPVTRTRSVPKTYPYGAWKYINDMKVNLNGKAELEGHALLLQVAEKLHEEDTEHAHSLPDIGLKPKKARITQHRDWLFGQSGKLASQLETELSRLWREMYCDSDGGGSFEDTGEKIMRCMRQPQKNPPAYAEAWYRENFGLNANEVNQQIGFTVSP